MQYGLIGEKLTHSFSKAIHESIADYTYELCQLKPEELDDFFAKRNFKAINVTIPYKRSVIKYLDWISREAKSIGAVNTIVNENGKLKGYNTDFFGLKLLIEKQNISFNGKKALILGNGGTSLTAKAVLNELELGEIFQVSRQQNDGCLNYSQIYDYDFDLIVNTTPVGMFPNNSQPLVDVNKFNNLKCAIDVIYNPLKSNLILEALNKGIKAEGGLYMLVAQAIFASEIFVSKKYDENLLDDIYNKIYKTKQNLVLIGMPSSGKTTIGEILANKLGRKFFDTDQLIKKNINMPISDFINQNGENKFRELESEIISEVSKNNGVVTSTGGGAVLNEKNIKNLKQNGCIIFLDRPLELLTPTSSRPLTQNRELLKQKYHERIDLYKKYNDKVYVNDKSIDLVVDKIIKDFDV